jgi:hypothetical protein
MVMDRTLLQSHLQLGNGALRPEPGHIEAHLHPQPPNSHLSMVFETILVFLVRATLTLLDFLVRASLAPLDFNFLFFSMISAESFGSGWLGPTPRSVSALSSGFRGPIPCLVSGASQKEELLGMQPGKGCALTVFLPKTPKGIPTLNPIEAHTSTQPTHESTLDLSPLSNPYACRIKWFDSLGNSLGFSPPPPSPPHHPPPPPLPPHHPPPPVTSTAPFTSSPSSVCPSSSSDSPLSPPLPSACPRCAERAALEDSLDDLKRGLGDVKTAIHELQSKESERWNHVDLLMSFLQDLRQAISDRDMLARSNLQVHQAFVGQRFDPGTS